ncbi:MAG: hypothetical protein AAF481_03550 [Acidobacteriota bacterium]
MTTPSPSTNTADWLFFGLLGALLLWGSAFIHRSSFEVEGERVYALFDDAMISMTYARNAVEGHGLNWAREGEPVEGFTTPLWTAVMALVNALPVPLERRSLGIQALVLLLLAAHLALLRRLAVRFFSEGVPPVLVWFPALLLTAGYYPLAYWSLMGMETALQALWTTAAVYWTLVIREGTSAAGRGGWRLGAILALAYLTRMDMALLAGACLGWLALTGRSRSEHRWRAVAVAAVLPVAAALGYQVFRLAVFDAPLPNTYDLKLTGIPLDIRLPRGGWSLLAFAREHLYFLLLFALAIVPRLRRQRHWLLPALIVLLYSAYSVWVGGDAWEVTAGVHCNRFMVFTMPLLFLLASSVVGEVFAGWIRRCPSRRRRLWTAEALLAVAILASANGLLPNRSAEVLKENWAAVTLTDKPLMVTGHEIVYRRLRQLESHLAPPARVATFWAGIPAYFSDYRMVDMLGYSDRHIARLEPAEALRRAGYRAYRPGHVKGDYRYVFLERRPDAFLQAWGMQPERLKRVMRARGFRLVDGFWMRPKSPFRRPASPEGKDD